MPQGCGGFEPVPTTYEPLGALLPSRKAPSAGLFLLAGVALDIIIDFAGSGTTTAENILASPAVGGLSDRSRHRPSDNLDDPTRHEANLVDWFGDSEGPSTAGAVCDVVGRSGKACSGLVHAPPQRPTPDVCGRMTGRVDDTVEQPSYLVDGQRDQAVYARWGG